MKTIIKYEDTFLEVTLTKDKLGKIRTSKKFIKSNTIKVELGKVYKSYLL